jgi:hypothetical protein
MIALPVPNPLPVTPRKQEGYFSCWSTSAEMIMEFIGGERVRQCDQAGSALGSCCDAKGNLIRGGDCDSPSLPDFGAWGYEAEHQFGKPLTWAEIQKEIDGGRPFAFSWGLIDSKGNSLGVSHMLVVIGYEEGNGQKALLCFNPRPLSVTRSLLVPFEEYEGKVSANALVGPNTSGNPITHEHDYYRISPPSY